MNIFFTFLGLL